LGVVTLPAYRIKDLFEDIALKRTSPFEHWPTEIHTDERIFPIFYQETNNSPLYEREL
jgi:hypothetical protein